MTVFTEISILFGVTFLVTQCIRMLKQPLIVGYILSGILVGPYALNLFHSKELFEIFSKVGIVFLLFIVGLHLNPKVIKEVGRVSLITGVGQVVFTSVVGFILALLLGIERVAALYVAIALTFSSTIIILKLLADKKDLQKLYAKIAVGFLLVQDVIATMIFIGLTIFAQSGTGSLPLVLATTVFKGVAVIVTLMLVSKHVIPRILPGIARSQEFLFLFTIAWSMGLASVFALIGFSVEIGALVAGVMLSVTAYADEMASRLRPLRDFFLIVFFLLLGSQMVLSDIGTVIVPAILLSLFVLVGNPIIVIILMNVLGFHRRTGFLAGLTVAQISEFSLILATIGMQMGHLNQTTLSLITLVGLITIAGSTYLILYAEKIYPRLVGALHFLELLKKKRSQSVVDGVEYNALVFGYDRVGHYFVEALRKKGYRTLVVDYNPQSIELLQQSGIAHAYGDAGDAEFLEELPIKKPKVLISTVPDHRTNMLVLSTIRSRNAHVLSMMIAQTRVEMDELYDRGATYVMMPHYLGAEYASNLLAKYDTDHLAYSHEREKQLKSITAPSGARA